MQFQEQQLALPALCLKDLKIAFKEVKLPLAIFINSQMVILFAFYILKRLFEAFLHLQEALH